ncbi:MAG: hypothetical protein P8O19_04195 [Woeseiaceae bacterium]|jgi:hypothetical protein|nr:hypothetical protein [Woeseiaceae bacterium]MDG1016045.1 hypothetical protein [Woeseiaceae bacterium]
MRESNSQRYLINNCEEKELRHLVSKFDLKLKIIIKSQKIPGSYWGDPEAGLIGKTIFVKNNTPLHSFLHEFSHLICMSEELRLKVIRDAKSDDAEESAVCYLQILLADFLQGIERSVLMQDMDDWGYSFRLGSTEIWFQNDASDSIEWLKREKILDKKGNISWLLRK